MSELSERSRKILWAIIQSHIESNTPVGSLTVSKRYSFGLSPATIRNTMVELEEMGYVTQPHTSAGRVPTIKGYRLYVNTLLREHIPTTNKALFYELTNRLRVIKKDINRLFKETSKTLSIFSKYIGIATPPKIDKTTLKYIRFIKYDETRVLSTLISEEGIIKSRVIELEESYSQRHLDRIGNYLNDKFSGMTLMEVRNRIAAQLSKDKVIYDKLMDNALTIFENLIMLETDNIPAEVLSGTCNLPDFASTKQIKEILKAIEDKQLMLKLIDKVSNSGDGIQVYVGLENILPSMKELSMVASTYRDRGHICGAVGIIGPTRMDYGRLIPIVDHTAKALTQILSGG
jgi:heat-inducible transcriptional repressor